MKKEAAGRRFKKTRAESRRDRAKPPASSPPSTHKHTQPLPPPPTSGSTIVCGSRAHAVLMRWLNILGVTRPASRLSDAARPTMSALVSKPASKSILHSLILRAEVGRIEPRMPSSDRSTSTSGLLVSGVCVVVCWGRGKRGWLAVAGWGRRPAGRS